ncbi:MAG: hypothetical protein DRJ11_05390 [Candidatus Aminicenantes bacterium]|nr:MAG: hypothetical protein DRJ11_05390 [Candidatus Aminicenantes bacterium]
MNKFKKFGIINSLIFLIFSLTLLLGASLARGDELGRLILTNCQIIDCSERHQDPLRNMTIIIEGNRIVSIKKGKYDANASEEESRVIDLKNAFVIPGLWNVHVHLSDIFPDPNHIQDGELLASAVIRAGLNAMDGLQHGFTGIRVVGEKGYLDVAWRDAFEQGLFLGPRIFACGEVVSPTGGHRGDIAGGADGVAAIRRAVRAQIQRGVDWIKIMEVEMLDDEVQTAVEVAHHNGLRVAAHSREPTTYRSVKLGVDSIEHGYGLKDETIKLMAKKGTFYVPTIVCNLSDQYILEREKRLAQLGFANNPKIVRARTMIAYADERSAEHALWQRLALQKAARAGVKICVGSDSNPIGELGYLEIEQLVLSGLTPREALVAATRNCAELCGVLDKLGTVEIGKLADLVVLSDNPIENISNIRKVQMVIKDGVIVKPEKFLGASRLWDFYNISKLKSGFLAEAEKAAGFSRGKIKQ